MSEAELLRNLVGEALMAPGSRTRRARMLAILGMCAALGASMLAFAGESQPKRVLVITTRFVHETKQHKVFQEINEVLTQNPEVQVVQENLEWDPDSYWQSGPTPTLRNVWTAFDQYFRAKYRESKFDLVILAHEPAMVWGLQRRYTFFKDIPILYCGFSRLRWDTSNYPPELLKLLGPPHNVTGITDREDFEGTLELILRTQPYIDNIAIILGSEPWSKKAAEDFEKILHKYPETNFIRLFDKTTEELKKAIRELPTNTAIYHMSFRKSREGIWRKHIKEVKVVSDLTRLPIYHHRWLSGHHLSPKNLPSTEDHTVLAIRVRNLEKHGRAAAAIAQRILKGESPNLIPIPSRPQGFDSMFDYAAMQRHKIPMQRLPKEAIVVNQPDSFYHQYKTYLWSAAALILALGCIALVLWLNVLRRKRAERALRISEEQYRKESVTKTYLMNLLDSISELLIVVDDKKKITSINSYGKNLLHFQEKELIGKPISALISEPPDHEFGYIGPDIVEALIGRSPKEELCVYIRPKYGNTIPMMISFGDLFEGNNREFTGCILTGKDIRRRKKLEDEIKRMASLHQYNPGPVASLNTQGQIVLANEVLVQLKQTDSLIGRPWSDICPEIKEHRLNALVTEQGQNHHEAKFGKETFLLTYRNIPEADMINVYGANITQIKHLHAQVTQASKLASIGILAAGVGHEINNPLTIIMGNITRVRKYTKELQLKIPELKRALEAQDTAIERIRKIVDGLRSYARPTTDATRPFDVHRAIESTTQLIRTIYEKEGVDIETKLNAQKSIVFGNEGKFQQVIMNLMANAKDALEKQKHPAKIEVITRNTKQAPEKVEIIVKDNGEGIKKELLSSIFDTFFTTKPIGKGTGLGLSIVSSFIKSMEGTIEALSEIGKGTQMRCLLPIATQMSLNMRPTVDSPKERKENAPDETSPKQQPKARKGNALVVDDEAAIRLILKNYLAELGLRVDEAKSGPLAMNKVKQKHYDYIFTDIKMPGMDGRQFVREAKANGQQTNKTKFVLMTGGVEEVEQTQLPQEADAIVLKPFTFGDISGEISV